MRHVNVYFSFKRSWIGLVSLLAFLQTAFPRKRYGLAPKKSGQFYQSTLGFGAENHSVLKQKTSRALKASEVLQFRLFSLKDLAFLS